MDTTKSMQCQPQTTCIHLALGTSLRAGDSRFCDVISRRSIDSTTKSMPSQPQTACRAIYSALGTSLRAGDSGLCDVICRRSIDTTAKPI